MKIKKIFSLVSVASLAVLMTACGNAKKDGILDTDTFISDAVKIEDYKEQSKAKKEVVKIFENQKVVSSYSNVERGIYITYDDDKYYVYNLFLENPKILEFNKEDVTSVVYYSMNNNYILVNYKAVDDKYSYACYMPDGKCILEKTELTSTPTVTYQEEFDVRKGLLDKNFEFRKYLLTYKTKDSDDKVTSNYIYFYVGKEDDASEEKYEYYLADEFEKEFRNAIDMRYDGAALGLKGYSIQIVESTIYVFKKDKLVNVIKLTNGEIMGNGYVLFQKITEVGINEKYDIYYGGAYLKVNTYKINLLNSKMTEVKNFHYLISGYIDYVYSKDDEGNITDVKGYMVKVFDFKEKKSVTASDVKVAIVKGNGDIEINKKLIQDNTDDIILDDKYYYSYNDETTVVRDKNGKIIDIYNGCYFDGVKAIFDSNDNCTFINKEGKKVLYLKDTEFYYYNKFTGTNLFGEKVIVTIENGEIKTAKIDGYTLFKTDEFFTKTDSEENYVTFYTFDDTLTRIDLGYDSDEYTFSYGQTYDGRLIYSLINKDDNTVTMLYFK